MSTVILNTVYKLSLLYSVVVRDSTFNILRISNNVDVSGKVSVYLGKLLFYKVQPQLTSKYLALLLLFVHVHSRYVDRKSLSLRVQ